MREFDGMGLRICRFQGEVFEMSRNLAACSSPVFLRRFMNSAVAVRIDKNGILFEASDKAAMIDEIEREFGESSYGKIKYGEDELYWIGYIYRYWCYTREKSSKQVYRIVKPAELRQLYFPYHSLAPSQAIERILEAKGWEEDDYTAKGVDIMRNVLHRRKLHEQPPSCNDSK